MPPVILHGRRLRRFTLSSTTLSPPLLVVDEGSSTNGSFSTLTNPDGDGKNYRLGTWTASGLFVVTTGGLAQYLLSGGGGGGDGPDRSGGSYGGAGSVIETVAYPSSGTYTVTLGAAGGAGGGAGGTSSLIKVPTSRTLANQTFRLSCPGGAGAYSENTPGTADNHGANGEGQGGGTGANYAAASGVGTTTGVTSTITGASVIYGAIGSTADKGMGGTGGSFGTQYAGGPGVLYIRWEI